MQSQILHGWAEQQKRDWYTAISRYQIRDYDHEIVQRLKSLPTETHHVVSYGDVNVAHKTYPLLSVNVGDFLNEKPNVLITAGVHGYEPSGVRAAVYFLKKYAAKLSDEFNFVVFPCMSPWSYEFDHRWNAQAEDPNRCCSFDNGTPQIDECTHFMNMINNSGVTFDIALDLHETPDRDITLRQERSSRFGTPLANDYKVIPQGYYLMLSAPDHRNFEERLHFGNCILREVRKVSPIAPEPLVLGKPNYSGMTVSKAVKGTMREFLSAHAGHIGVVEAYPDHPEVEKVNAVKAQLASINGALNFLRNFPK